MSLQQTGDMRDVLTHHINKGLSGDLPGTVHKDSANPTSKYAATVYELFGEKGECPVAVRRKACPNPPKHRRPSVVQELLNGVP
jgi:hypothetical protein